MARALKNGWLRGFAASAFVGVFVLGLPFHLIILLAALTGHFGGRLTPQVFAVSGGHGAARQGYGPALIDDATPTPAHALFSRSRLAKVLLTGLGLWLAAMAFLLTSYGWQGTLTLTA